jgi:hypothetical protein
MRLADWPRREKRLPEYGDAENGAGGAPAATAQRNTARIWEWQRKESI